MEANEKAIGWSGGIKASIPDATATIQAKVVAPLKCDPLKVKYALLSFLKLLYLLNIS